MARELTSGATDALPEAFLRDLPKTDLHVHLDGSVRISTLIDLAREYHVELPSYTEDGLRTLVFKDRYANLAEYLRGFGYTVGGCRARSPLSALRMSWRSTIRPRGCATSRSASRRSCMCTST